MPDGYHRRSTDQGRDLEGIGSDFIICSDGCGCVVVTQIIAQKQIEGSFHYQVLDKNLQLYNK